jgi:hypothetical protein
LVQLVRALGTLGRLTDSDGKFQSKETGELLDAYMRAKIIGGKDINPREVALAAKYSRVTGQTMNSDAWLMTFLAMPDLRGSSFANGLNQMVKQLTGGATVEKQKAQAEYGLIDGGIRRTTARGPGKFVYDGTKDETLLRENPYVYFAMKFMAPGDGIFAKHGLDPTKASAAEMANVLAKFFSRETAADLANKMANQQAEWNTQKENAKRLNMSDDYIKKVTKESVNAQIQQAGQQFKQSTGDAAEAIATKLLPAFDSLSTALNNVSKQINGEAAPVDMNSWLFRNIFGPLADRNMREQKREQDQEKARPKATPKSWWEYLPGGFGGSIPQQFLFKATSKFGDLVLPQNDPEQTASGIIARIEAAFTAGSDQVYRGIQDGSSQGVTAFVEAILSGASQGASVFGETITAALANAQITLNTPAANTGTNGALGR